MKRIKFIEIKKYLIDKSLSVESEIPNNTKFKNIASLQESTNDDLSFFSNINYLNQLKKTKAKACLISRNYAKYLPENCYPIIVENPYYIFALLTKLFFSNKIISNGIISNNAYLHKNTSIENNVQIDSFSYIDENTKIKNDVVIGSNCKIGPNVEVGKNCIIHDNVSISNSVISDTCEIQSGARIGGSGFGFEEKSKEKIFHNGSVIIKKNSTIGSNTTIDRAVFGSTSVGEFSQIDNLVQIAHNVIIGDHAIIASQVGIAGSTTIGNYVKIGGQAGISGHLKIGDNVTIAGKSGVTKNIENNKIVAGFPAKDIKIWKKEIIKMSLK